MKTGTSHVGTTLTKLNKLKKLLDIAMTERRFSLVKRTCSVTVILSVVLFVCIVRVFTGRKDETKYNDLITTGGAIRRSTHLVVPNFNYTVCKTKQCRNVEKYIKKSMDLKANPCTDFFNFTCGGWINKNPIPKTSSSYSTFAKLNSKVEKALRKIIENNTRMDNEYMKKAKMFYKSCSNLIAIEKRDAKPLVDLILDIGSSKLFHPQSWHEKNWNLTQILLGIHKKYASSGGPLFSVHVSNDPRNNTKHILEIDQAGPSLSREVYFDDKKIIKAYTQFIADVAVALGEKEVEAMKQAKSLVDLETKLAKISVPSADKTDSWFKQMTMKQLDQEVPEFPWLHYIQELFSHTKITNNEPVIVPALSYLKKVGNIISNTSTSTLSNYVVWNVIQDEIPNLSKRFRDIRNRYKNKVLGSHGQKKRWKTCVSVTNDYLGDIIGDAYRKKHFDKKKKTLAEKMIVNVRKAFQVNVAGLSWMDATTIDAVQDKAHAMRDEVGYPDYYDNTTKYTKRFQKYKKVIFKPDTLFSNKLSLLKMSHQRMLKKLRKPVDKEEWPLDPQTINAMYSFNENQMVIPAGILQPPFFHGVDAPKALMYGAIGAILGHELTHGFDNTGRKFNKHGELTKQWWTKDSLKHFSTRADCIEKQYNNYRVRGKYKLNGKLTLGENIADNGGFRASQMAYKNWLISNHTQEIRLPGLEFTNEQLFFISFAQAYCSNSRPTQDYLATLSDPHSDERFRVIGVLSNSKEFSRAFKCPVGSAMNPKTKCAVWISDSVIEDETKTHEKLFPKHQKDALKKPKSKPSRTDVKSKHRHEKEEKRKHHVHKKVLKSRER